MYSKPHDPYILKRLKQNFKAFWSLHYFQKITNCECKTFIGSVAEMKGNEARIVFFLHPVNQLKDGYVVSKENAFGILCVYILGFLLERGVLLYFLPSSDRFNLDSARILPSIEREKGYKSNTSDDNSTLELSQGTTLTVIGMFKNICF